MSRYTKAIGLALIAVAVAGATSAATAQATEAEFEWASGTTKIVGESDPTAPSQEFVITPGAITSSFTCDEFTAEATVSGTAAKTLTFPNVSYRDTGTTPEAACTGKVNGISLKVTGNSNECDFKAIAGTTVGTVGEGKSEGTVGVECPSEKKIEILAAGCTVKIGPQTIGPVYYSTIKTGSGLEHITAEAKIGQTATTHNNAIDYSTSGLTCGTKTETDGTYKGNVTFTGFNSSGTTTNLTVT
jgi:hypothetical protein